ncbi:hypothetical protein [Nocardia inohanensis]|uniref:hypothetical protein n=1 Tax=Nocardia inohanensis TaxID=209246 RepID=UPI00082E096C|nr:hypothetical protein [Nocardia inohanensis]
MATHGSKLKTLLTTATLALAATGALTLTVTPALADTSPGTAATPVPARTQGWLKIYTGTAPTGINAVQLKVINDPKVGPRVADSGGRSLYRFDKDTANPSVSNCNGDCATTWPPLLVARGQALYLDGINPAETSFIERADGSCQITIGGRPIYYFSKDRNPGDLNGQGVGGTWFAVAPTGAKAQAA